VSELQYGSAPTRHEGDRLRGLRPWFCSALGLAPDGDVTNGGCQTSDKLAVFARGVHGTTQFTRQPRIAQGETIWLTALLIEDGSVAGQRAKKL
jgi:hypothetical protein